MSFPTMGGRKVHDAELEDEAPGVEGDVSCALRGRSRDAKDKREHEGCGEEADNVAGDRHHQCESSVSTC